MAPPIRHASPHTQATGQIATGEERGADMFLRAERHSRRVRALKIWLPGLAAIGIAGFVGWSYLAVPDIAGISVQGAAVTDGKLVMANPKLDGFTRDNLPYSMTAARAIQDIKQTGVIALEDIDAKVPISAKSIARIVADTGIYDNTKNTLVIDSAVTVTTSDGMVAKLQSASVDIASGLMTTPDPVDITLDGSRISADSLTVSENGKVLVFERRVRVDLKPEKASPGTNDEGKADAAD